LLNHFPGEAIAPAPELADRAPFAFVVDPFLVRAADDATRHRDRERSLFLDEFQYLASNIGVGPNVATVHLPVPHRFHLAFSDGTMPTATFVAWLRFGP